jgi:hypothetical protein
MKISKFQALRGPCCCRALLIVESSFANYFFRILFTVEGDTVRKEWRHDAQPLDAHA